MPTKTIIPGSIYIFNATEDQYKSGSAGISGSTITYPDKIVEIHSQKIDHNYNNELKIRPIAESPGDRGKLPQTQIIDLKKIIESLDIQGILDDEPTENANTKKNNLLNLGKAINLSDNKTGAELSVVWNTGSYQTFWRPNLSKREHGAFIGKMKFTETSGIYGEAVTSDPQPFRKIDVIISLFRGKDI